MKKLVKSADFHKHSHHKTRRLDITVPWDSSSFVTFNKLTSFGQVLFFGRRIDHVETAEELAEDFFERTDVTRGCLGDEGSQLQPL